MNAYELGKALGMGKQADLRSWFASMMSGPPPAPEMTPLTLLRPPGAKPPVPAAPGAPVPLPSPVTPAAPPMATTPPAPKTVASVDTQQSLSR